MYICREEDYDFYSREGRLILDSGGLEASPEFSLTQNREVYAQPNAIKGYPQILYIESETRMKKYWKTLGIPRQHRSKKTILKQILRYLLPKGMIEIYKLGLHLIKMLSTEDSAK